MPVFYSAKLLQNSAFSKSILQGIWLAGPSYCRTDTFLGPEMRIYAYINTTERYSGLKLAFLQQNGSFFWPKFRHFQSFRTTFSVTNREMPIFIARNCCNYRHFRTVFQDPWQTGVFTAERSPF